MHAQRQIKKHLTERKWTVLELAKHFECTPQNIRYHIGKLKALRERKNGTVWYWLE